MSRHLCILAQWVVLLSGIGGAIIGTLNSVLYIAGNISSEQYQWQRLPLATLCFAAAAILSLLLRNTEQ